MLPGNQTFQVEWRVLRALNGWQLKAYILLSNSPQGLSCREIAEAYGADKKTVWLALIGLCEKAYVLKQGETYRVVKIPPLGGEIPTVGGEIPKEKFPHTPLKENSLTSSAKNARTHSLDLNFFISQITNDPNLTSYAQEFLQGQLAAGEDLEARGPADLKRHFNNWLPKYKAKREIESRKAAALKVEREKPDYQIEEQMRAKRRREEKAAELQRQLDAQQAEAEVAGDARAAFFARYGKGTRRNSAEN